MASHVIVVNTCSTHSLSCRRAPPGTRPLERRCSVSSCFEIHTHGVPRLPFTTSSTSLLTGKKCGIRAPFVARSLRFVGTPHRSFWMVCSSGHDRMADTLERNRVRAESSSNLSETTKMGVGRKCRPSRSLRRHLIALATFGLTSSRRVSERQNGVYEHAKHPKRVSSVVQYMVKTGIRGVPFWRPQCLASLSACRAAIQILPAARHLRSRTHANHRRRLLCALRTPPAT